MTSPSTTDMREEISRLAERGSDCRPCRRSSPAVSLTPETTTRLQIVHDVFVAEEDDRRERRVERDSTGVAAASRQDPRHLRRQTLAAAAGAQGPRARQGRLPRARRQRARVWSAWHGQDPRGCRPSGTPSSNRVASVLFAPTYRLVQDLLAAKRDLELPRALRKLDHYELLILDDIGYVQQDADEIEVLFTLVAERYERPVDADHQ